MTSNSEYSKLKKKYKKLPNLKWLKNNFKFYFEDEPNALWQIKTIIAEKLEHVNEDFIEPIIFSTESYETWIKKKMFSKKERADLFETYKELKRLIWISNKLEIEYSEKDFAEWIIDVVGFWDSNKETLEKMCEKIGNGWKEYHPSSNNTRYHG